jgi:hypothetical protein
MKPLTHRTSLIVSPLNPQKAVSIDEFIAAESAEITAQKFRKLIELIPNLRAKMQTDQARSHYDLIEGLIF